MDNDTLSVERTIAAPASAIFAYVSDAGKHQEIDGSGTVRGTRKPSQPLKLGSVFGMAMHQGVGYRTKNTVVELEPDRLLAWQTRPLTPPLPWFIGGRIWRYELSEVEGGTHVVETWDLRPERNRALVRPLAGDPVADMSATLERLEELVS